MRKLLSIITLLCSFVLLSSMYAKAEDSEISYVRLKTFVVENGDEISLDRSKGSAPFLYRVSLNDTRYLDVDMRGYNWGNLKFFESSSYYIFYGSMQTDEANFRSQLPFILRLPKNISSYKLHYNEDVTEFGYMTSLVEYPINSLVAIENVSGSYYFGTYSGRYSLFSFDEDLNVVKSISVASEECTVSVAYSVIEVKLDGGECFYFDQEFNRLDEYPTEMNLTGSFDITTDTYVNGKLYKLGTTFNTPGSYTLDDGVHSSLTINLEPIITGISNDESYDNYVEYKVSGGSVYLDNKLVYLNGIVSDVGNHTLVVRGLDDYEREYNFTIKPELITDLSDGGTMYIGDKLTFTGYARVNDGEFITESYEIKESGTYKLSLYASTNNDAVKTLYFNVPEVKVTKTDKTWAYFVLGISILGISGATLLLIFGDKKKKRNKKEIVNNN